MDRNLTPHEVERILQRASEMAGTDDVETGISEPALVAAAEEAGIPAAAVRHSIAVERLGEVPSPRRVDRLVGPSRVIVDVGLAMAVSEAMARLDAWLVSGHHLRRERWGDDVAEWRRKEGILTAGSRAARHAYGEGRLSDVRGLVAVARPTDDGVVLRVAIDRTQDRAGWLGSGTAVAAASTGAVVVGAVAAFPVVALLAPVGIGIGAGIARAGRSQAESLERELRRVLDAVEHRVRPTTLRQDLTRWALLRGR